MDTDKGVCLEPTWGFVCGKCGSTDVGYAKPCVEGHIVLLTFACRHCENHATVCYTVEVRGG